MPEVAAHASEESFLPEAVHAHGWRDCMLHALAIGAGLDPAAEHDHHLLDENRMRAAPDMVSALLEPSRWYAGVSSLLLHEVTWHAPVPVEAELLRSSRVAAVSTLSERSDRMEVEHRILHRGRVLATGRQVILTGVGTARSEAHPPGAPKSPDGPPDGSVAVETHRQMALIYAESAGGQPLTFDPSAARAAGLDRPVLADLAVAGIARRVLAEVLGNSRPHVCGKLSARFVGHAYPGDSLCTEVWLSGNAAQFRTSVTGGAVICDGRYRPDGNSCAKEGRLT